MDINRVSLGTLAQNGRPKILTHLKHSSIKFQQQKESAFAEHRAHYKRAFLGQNFRTNAFSSGQSRIANTAGHEFEEDATASFVNDLKASKKMKSEYEYASKSHLTSAPGQSPEYKSTHQREYQGIREFDQEHISRIKDLKSFLSSTTYSIGRKAFSASPPPQESSNQT